MFKLIKKTIGKFFKRKPRVHKDDPKRVNFVGVQSSDSKLDLHTSREGSPARLMMMGGEFVEAPPKPEVTYTDTTGKKHVSVTTRSLDDVISNPENFLKEASHCENNCPGCKCDGLSNQVQQAVIVRGIAHDLDSPIVVEPVTDSYSADVYGAHRSFPDIAAPELGFKRGELQMFCAENPQVVNAVTGELQDGSIADFPTSEIYFGTSKGRVPEKPNLPTFLPVEEAAELVMGKTIKTREPLTTNVKRKMSGRRIKKEGKKVLDVVRGKH